MNDNKYKSLIFDSLANSTVIDLAQPLSEETPYSPNAPGFKRSLFRRHGDKYLKNKLSFASDIFTTGTHVGTHIDALSHISNDNKLFGGVDALVSQQGGSFEEHGIQRFPPFVGRGVLLDVPKFLGMDVLEPAQGVDRELLTSLIEAESIEIRRGDAVLIRTGWGIHYANPTVFLGHESGVPGITEDAAYWLAEQSVALVGGETIAFEMIPAGVGHADMPVHRVMLTEFGIPIVEVMKLDALAQMEVKEFLFMLSPLNMVGATGSPVRPIALVH